MDDSGEETHHFGKNRGDFTYFTFTTPSWLQHISKHGSFTPHAIALPPILSLGTSRAAFFRVASRPETYMAVGASQIHLHIAHLTSHTAAHGENAAQAVLVRVHTHLPSC